MLTRYIGLSVVVMLVLVLVGRGAWKRGLVAAALALVPVLGFLVWIAARGGGGARTISFHLATQNSRFFRFAGYSFFPFAGPDAPRTIALAVAATVVALAIWFTRALRSDLVRACVIYIVAYLSLVVLTRTFLDANTPFDTRLLAPIRGIAYALALAIAYDALSRVAKPAVAAGALGGAALLLVVANWGQERKLYDTMDAATRTRTPAEQALAALPRDARIVTNTPDVVWNQTGRGSYMLPGRVTYISRETNPDYDARLAAWKPILASRPSYAFFGTPPIARLAGPNDLAPLRLTRIAQSGAETLYRIG